jgi:hypothetical protein
MRFTAWQVPPAQFWHFPLHAVSQQTLSAQKPEVHSRAAAQDAPFDLGGGGGKEQALAPLQVTPAAHSFSGSVFTGYPRQVPI